jgi:acyl transferase domain-containing protein
VAYFSAPYQIFADDVSALGPQKYLTSTQFQSALWQRLLAEMVLAEKPRARDEFEDVSLLFEEGYNRVLAPVAIGESVGVLVSLEERGPSAVRVFFRAIRRDGEPVACGFQTVACASHATGEPARLPLSLSEFLSERADLRESAVTPTFAERLLAGGDISALFPDEARTLGARLASQPAERPIGARPSRATGTYRSIGGMRASGGMRPSGAMWATGEMRATSEMRATGEMRATREMRATGELRATREMRATGAHRVTGIFPISEPARRSGAFVGPLPEFADLVVRDRGIAFVFPGLGSYDGRVLRELYDYMPYLDEYFEQADAVARRRFRQPFLPLIHATSLAEHDEYLRRCPDLEQLGIFLTGVLLAEALQEKSVRPDVLVGHGFGELAALATAGAFDVATGFEIVAHRALALRALPEAGGVEALAGATARYRGALGALSFATPRMQVYSPGDLAPYSPSINIADALASQLVRPVDFGTTVSGLRAAGCEYFVECGTGTTLRDVLRQNLPNERSVIPTVVPDRSLAGGLLAAAAALTVSATPAPAPSVPAPEAAGAADTSGGWPIAIVGMGCVLPGARNPDEFWRNILEGISGITQLGLDDPRYDDFVALDDVVPDKTYSLLSGSVGTIEHDPRVPYTREEFFALSRAQQLLTLAVTQCLDRPRAAWAPKPKRSACLLGSTADGIREYDETLMIDGLRRYVLSFDDEPAELRTAFADGLGRLAGLRSGDPDTFAPFASYRSVVERVLGSETETVLLDAAGASSLYAASLATEFLWNQGYDFVIAGGVFSPGPANGPLFAQFRGLATTDCYPFDERADGLIFGEGAAVLAFKRLSDAMAAGDRIYAVVRGVGVSSDGKSPSLNVPRAAGETLAMRRAYASSGIDTSTIQLLEAHATSQPVADVTEFDAVRAVFGKRDPKLPPISLQSATALIGNTAWLAGAASLMKVCRALEERVMPPQYNFSVPHPGIDLANSPFDIPMASSPWPANVSGLPRRAAVNGFGLGGTNGHAIVEAFDPTYHKQLAARTQRTPSRVTLAIVSVGSRFAADRGAGGNNGLSELPPASGGAPFRSGELIVSDQRRLLPEALEQVDVSQWLALTSAERALKHVPLWAAQRERIGVALGLVGKTARGVMATERIYLHRLQRLLEEQASDFGLDREHFDRFARRLADGVFRDNVATNPFTAAGTMPNFAASRVANMFDLNGPSVVIDAGGASLLEVLRQAQLWLSFGDADLVLAGGVDIAGRHHPARPAASAAAGAHGIGGEGACLLAVTTPELARAHDWVVRALVAVDDPEEHSVTIRGVGDSTSQQLPVESSLARYANRITGVGEVAAAVDATRSGKVTTLHWRSGAELPPGHQLDPVTSSTLLGSASQA